MAVVSFKTLIAAFLFILFLYSCTDHHSNIAAFKALDNSLQQSNDVINHQIENIRRSMDEKLYNPGTAYSAKPWKEKEEKLTRYAEDIIKYIHTLKEEVIAATSFESPAKRANVNEGSISIGEKMFKDKGKGKALHQKLRAFTRQLYSMDSFFMKEFQNENFLIVKGDSLTTSFELSFINIPTVAVLAKLTALENSVLIIQHRLLTIFDSNATLKEHWYHTNILIGTSSSYLRKGDTLEVVAGVGKFSIEARPEIIMNGTTVPVGYDGAAHYTFAVSGKPGKHYIHTTINYTDQDGQKRSISRRIEYNVIPD